MRRKRPASELRIIGGTWRSRKLPFAADAGVRPTPDRVRETLFNWLQGLIRGARCLDLFAGSGALGLEALSRGAADVVMVDHDVRIIQLLQRNIEQLDAQQRAHVVWRDALDYLQGPPCAFDAVFLDPPYREVDLLRECCLRLDAGGWLAPHARVYMETERRHGLPELPRNWAIVHSKHAGQVSYHLATAD